MRGGARGKGDAGKLLKSNMRMKRKREFERCKRRIKERAELRNEKEEETKEVRGVQTKALRKFEPIK